MKINNKWLDLTMFIIVTLLVLLFLYAAFIKLYRYDNTLSQMSESPFITEYAFILAWAVPLFEIIISIALLIAATRLIGFYLSLFLMTLFTVYIYGMLHYSNYVPCSCGGILNKMNWQQHFWFNILFVLLSVAGILLHSKMNNSSDLDHTEGTVNAIS